MSLTSDYKTTEFGALPNDWTVAPIKELQPFITSGSRGWAEYYSEFGDAFVRITNMDRDCIYLDLSDLKFVKLPEHETEGRRTQLREGDVLISITADIGISAYVGPTAPSPAYINQHVALVRFDKEKLNSKYISYFLAGKAAQKRFTQGTDTGAKAGMSLRGVANTLLVLPTKEEQDAIANALSDMDDLLAKLDQLIAKKSDIKKGAMQELLTGKRRLPGFSGEWTSKRVDSLAVVDPEQIGAGTPPDFEMKYISLENVDKGNLLGCTVVSFEDAPSRARRKIGVGDILVSTVRPNLQSHLLFSEQGKNWVCSTGFSVVRCKENVAHPGFLFQSLFGRSVESQIDKLISGSNYPAINSSDVKALEIITPEFDEQLAIATVLSDMDNEIIQLRQKRSKLTAIKQGMMQQLLTGRIRLV
jgi:type I restriction enzyme, S subunit